MTVEADGRIDRQKWFITFIVNTVYSHTVLHDMPLQCTFTWLLHVNTRHSKASWMTRTICSRLVVWLAATVSQCGCARSFLTWRRPIDLLISVKYRSDSASALQVKKVSTRIYTQHVKAAATKCRCLEQINTLSVSGKNCTSNEALWFTYNITDTCVYSTTQLLCRYSTYTLGQLSQKVHTQPFNCPLSGWAGTRKVKTNLDFTEARDSEWQWYQLGHMQVCTSLNTDNHGSTTQLSFLQAGCPSCNPTNSVKALKATLGISTLWARPQKVCHLFVTVS